MTRWVLGSNEPGQLPDTEPTDHLDWSEAADRLLVQIGTLYDQMGTVGGRKTGAAALDFIAARATVCTAPPEQPLSLFYAGRVYWLADLP